MNDINRETFCPVRPAALHYKKILIQVVERLDVPSFYNPIRLFDFLRCVSSTNPDNVLDYPSYDACFAFCLNHNMNVILHTYDEEKVKSRFKMFYDSCRRIELIVRTYQHLLEI